RSGNLDGAQSDDGHVVLARLEGELVADEVEHVFEPFGRVLDRVAQLVHALFKRRSPRFDEAVRVEEDHVAGFELRRRLPEARPEPDAERRRATAFEEDRRPAAAQEERRRMPGARIAADAAAEVEA